MATTADDDQGASPKELLIESCRRNNASLLSELLASAPLSSKPVPVAHFLNSTTDALGAGALHIAAQYGAYEVLDLLLDQEGVEIDGQERRDGDTCLHRAVRYCNELGAAGKGRGGADERERGRAVVEILLDAGCDPRIRNKAKLKPIDLVDPRDKELRAALQKAEITLIASQDVVEEDDDDVRDGPGSESD